MFREPFAAGHVFSMSMLDTLLYQVLIFVGLVNEPGLIVMAGNACLKFL